MSFLEMAELECIERKGMHIKINKTWISIVGGILLAFVIVWLFVGSKISCHESFWDKDKQVIEIKR